MAVLRMFFDESGKKGDHPVVTFAGVGAYEDKLPTFNQVWSELLNKYQIAYLHMKAASDLNKTVGPLMPAGQSFEKRTNALVPFADCINEHLQLGLVQAWDVKGFLGMDEAFKKGMGSPTDPYYIAFARSVVELVDHVSSSDQINLICDHDLETAQQCTLHLEAIKLVEDEVKQKINSLSFEDDDKVPALQAADMVAYLSRREARLMFYGQNYGFRQLFDYLTADQPSGKMVWLSMFADEARIKGLSLSQETI